MQQIKIKSNVNWCTHTLKRLTPICTHSENEIVFKPETAFNYEVIKDGNKLPTAFVFSYGPILYVNQINEQINLRLKEICSAYNNDGDYVYPVLIFEK